MLVRVKIRYIRGIDVYVEAILSLTVRERSILRGPGRDLEPPGYGKSKTPSIQQTGHCIK